MKLRTKDEWLRFNIMRFLMDRAWGRAPQEVNVEFNSNFPVKYTREEIARLSGTDIGSLARAACITSRQGIFLVVMIDRRPMAHSDAYVR